MNLGKRPEAAPGEYPHFAARAGVGLKLTEVRGFGAGCTPDPQTQTQTIDPKSWL